MSLNNSLESSTNDYYFPQIDFLKALAIISVIILHSLPRTILILTFSQFHIWQAVPILIILMGITSGISFTRMYSRYERIKYKAYFTNRIKRIVIPFLIIFIISLIGGFN